MKSTDWYMTLPHQSCSPNVFPCLFQTLLCLSYEALHTTQCICLWELCIYALLPFTILCKASISAHMLSAEYERLLEIKMIQTSKPRKLEFVRKARRIGLRWFLALQIEKVDRQNLNKPEHEESSVYWKYKFSHSWNQHVRWSA